MSEVSQQQIWEALQRGARRNRPTAKALSSFDGISDVVEESESTNKFDLLCPRENCGSIILKSGVATMVERESLQMQPAELPLPPSLVPLPTDSTVIPWWMISPSPMQFENIGFSRPVESLALSPAGKKLKLLACAECDLGPLGWSEEGGTEFFLACARVGYREV
ncbi:Mss4-like protein [Mycena floridula]|nr:Mss4-like protein [Mycena floridula]